MAPAGLPALTAALPTRTAEPAVIDVTMPAVVLNHLRALAATDARAPHAALATTRRLTGPGVWGKPTGKAELHADIEALDWMANELAMTTWTFVENRTAATQRHGFTIYDVDHAREAVHWARIELLEDLAGEEALPAAA
ncbi:hypothetical protein ACMATS_06445 [Streptoverticillium reticulum]|uniref:hypothetical protein n=1 Tax=Streptoverticillium reticulum TaxID=1433415 RepID=UPI0039BFD0DF